MKKRGKKVKIDADLDEEIDHYEPSSSDDGFDNEERHMLNNAVGRRQNEEERELLKIYSSSEESDEEGSGDEENEVDNEGDSEKEEEGKDLYGGGVGSDMDSDIEDKEKDDGLPDTKAWGSDKNMYYNTDFVDKDYLGFDDEEAAIEEEKEADAIQRRLLAHLEGTDFTLGLLDEVEDKKKEAARKKEEPDEFEEEEKVKVDLSSLTDQEALKLLKRESPEMFPLLKHCKSQVTYLQEKVWPIMQMVDEGILKKCKPVKLLELVNKLVLHYAMNVLYYLYAKENGVSIYNHPVHKRLNAFRSLLQEIDDLLKGLDPEIDTLLKAKEENEELVLIEEQPEPPPANRKEKRKRKLELLKIKQLAKKINKAKKRRLEIVQNDGYVLDLGNKVKKEEIKVQYEEEEENNEDEEEELKEAEEKRGVTFNILKNKGLTPKRKKENRNPRVKNRNKYKKAIKRRRGQIREPRKELHRYDGEISGIKRNISKSIKLK